MLNIRNKKKLCRYGASWLEIKKEKNIINVEKRKRISRKLYKCREEKKRKKIKKECKWVKM